MKPNLRPSVLVSIVTSLCFESSVLRRSARSPRSGRSGRTSTLMPLTRQVRPLTKRSAGWESLRQIIEPIRTHSACRRPAFVTHSGRGSALAAAMQLWRTTSHGSGPRKSLAVAITSIVLGARAKPKRHRPQKKRPVGVGTRMSVCVAIASKVGVDGEIEAAIAEPYISPANRRRSRCDPRRKRQGKALDKAKRPHKTFCLATFAQS
jgi:hypothetical protein